MVKREGCALVTGGSRGIGAATAQALAAEGWPVAVLSRGGGNGVGDLHLAADVTDAAAVDAAFALAERELGPVLVLVNNAGVRADGLAPSLADDEWNTVLDTNLSAAFRLTRRALRPMLRARYGRIVNVASIVGLRANPGQSNYAAAKAGLIAMTKTVAAEVARKGITVNAVAPGYIATDMTTDVIEAAAGLVPARRAGTPDEVAACIRFLASDEASYVTGSTLVVDGGLTA